MDKLTVIDMHTGGEPVRIVTSGYPPIPKGTILDKRAYVRANLDHLRKLLMFEPRGHDMMSGTILYPPTRPDCDVAVLLNITPDHLDRYDGFEGYCASKARLFSLQHRDQVAVRAPAPVGPAARPAPRRRLR